MTFLSRRKRPTTRLAPTRCARTAIKRLALGLAAGWLVGAGTASAQPKIIDVNWNRSDTPAKTGARTDTAAGAKGAIQPVSYNRMPTGQVQKQVGASTTGQLPPLPKAGKGYADSEVEFTVNTELPGPERLTRRESEDQWFERQRLETRPGAPRVFFPERLAVSKEPYSPRLFAQHVESVEPGFVVHRRLLFEQKNFDRAGWDLGPITPGITTGRFVFDVAFLPYHTFTRPCDRWDSSAGKCLPGDNTPLFWYHEEFSLTGLAAQAGAVGLCLVMFP